MSGVIIPTIILVVIIVFSAVASVFSYEFRNRQNNTQFNDGQKPKGFLDWLSEELRYKTQTEEYPQEYEYKAQSTKDLEEQKPKHELSYAQKPKKTRTQHDDFERLTFSQIAPPMVIEDEKDGQERSEFLELIEQDEDILKKLVLGDTIMTPKAKKRNYRKIF